MDSEHAEEWIKHRLRTMELSRIHAPGMAPLHVEQQQTQTVITQLFERVHGVDNVADAIGHRLTTIAEGVAGRHENTLRDFGVRLYALEQLANNARPPQPQHQPPPNYHIGSPVAEAANQPVPGSPAIETPWQQIIREGAAGPAAVRKDSNKAQWVADSHRLVPTP